jgi:hypothetical protein
MITIAVDIIIGAEVRRYDDPYLWDSYDLGTVLRIEDGWVVVDFFDWLERWPRHKFVTWQPFLTQHDVLVPVGKGEIIELFQPV